MRTKLISLSIMLLVGLLVSGYVLPSVLNAAPSQAPNVQVTPGVTLVPGVTVAPPVGTSIVVVPVTGGASDTSTLLFYGILVLAGMAFVIMLFALMRRPSDRL